MNVCQKDVVLLPYPFSDFEGEKVRPAIVVSNNDLNMKSEDCVMVPLTGVIKDESYSVLIKQENLAFGKLIKPSRARADKILAVDKSIIILRIGAINDRTFEEIKSEIGKIF